MKDSNQTDQTNPIKVNNAGKVFESIAESTALAVQDATTYLRNISTISTTAMGEALSHQMSTGTPGYYELVSSLIQIRQIVNDANYLSLIDRIESIMAEQGK